MSKSLEVLHINYFRNSHDNAGSGVLSLSAVANHIHTGGDGLVVLDFDRVDIGTVMAEVSQHAVNRDPENFHTYFNGEVK